MGLKQTIISQGVEPHGVLGRISAWVMVRLSDRYCGNAVELLDLGPDDALLDVGCGAGVLLERASIAEFVAGIDHSDVQVELARKRNRTRIGAGSTEVVHGDASDLPWADARFSAVACNCLGCFADPRASLDEMYRVLRPGGKAVFGFDSYPDERAARKAERAWGLPTWTEPEALALLESAGFLPTTVSRTKNNLLVAAHKASG